MITLFAGKISVAIISCLLVRPYFFLIPWGLILHGGGLQLSFWRMCVNYYNKWPCLIYFGVNVARSTEVHIKSSLDWILFLLEEHWATYLSHMCDWDWKPKWNTHWDAEVLASAIAFLEADSRADWGNDCHGWSGIPRIIWWTSRCYHFTSFWNTLEALLLSIFPFVLQWLSFVDRGQQ